MSLPALSGRQHETLTLIAEGLRDWEIAERMDIKITTVRRNVLVIRYKLGTRNRAHSVHVAYQTGVLKCQ